MKAKISKSSSIFLIGNKIDQWDRRRRRCDSTPPTNARPRWLSSRSPQGGADVRGWLSRGCFFSLKWRPLASAEGEIFCFVMYH